MPRSLRSLLSLTILAWAGASAPAADDALLTVAESSDYTETATLADVEALAEALAETSPRVRLDVLGNSVQGRSIPLLWIADPPIEDPAVLADDDRLLVLALGAIHGGEISGKEALLQLARELALADDAPLLEHVVLALAPVYNPDGNDAVGPTVKNRPKQVGPVGGVGERRNGLGLDLNRDWIKAEAPETRGVLRFLRRYDPEVVIDTHTTNGSRHRFSLTYAGPAHPAGDPAVVELVRDRILPGAGRRTKAASGHDTFFYGNFDADKTRWATYPAHPRFGTRYRGLRNRIAILTEAHAYVDYADRISVTREFVRAILEEVVARKDEIRETLAAADAAEVETVALRSAIAAFDRPVTIPGYVEDTKKKRKYTVEHLGRFEAARTVDAPEAYLFDSRWQGVVETLQQHGIEVSSLRGDVVAEVERYRVDAVRRRESPYQGHRTVEVDVTPEVAVETIPAGWRVVRPEGPLARLVVFLLEPESEDGLATWNHFDDALVEGAAFPVLRLEQPAPLLTRPLPPLTEDRVEPRRVRFEDVVGSERVSFDGPPLATPSWVEGESRYRIAVDGTRYVVDAESGRAELDETEEEAEETEDGEVGDELITSSPDGRLRAFVRDFDLWVEDADGGNELRLTEGGKDSLRFGKSTWVYFEEIFNRDWQAYWWSPDSKRIALMRFDDADVPRFTLVDDIPEGQELEVAAYPKPGQANPVVALGVAGVGGTGPIWASFEHDPDAERLITGVHWRPDGKSLLFFEQDRVQTRLTVWSWQPGDEPVELFTETTGRWVSNEVEPYFLADGGFLWASEQDGWRHLYRVSADGKRRERLTTGEWEVRDVELVDERAGFVYFRGTRDSHIAENLYRVPLAGGEVERLTPEPGRHATSLSDDGRFFIDRWSSLAEPPRLALRRADGTLVRWIDTNPATVLDGFRLGDYERMTIPTEDGFELEATILRPPDFDPASRYPVWFMTYAGPHAPTVRDAWSSFRFGWEQLIAAEGFVVFRGDPRSASGKGAVSTWTAYKQLGLPEVADIRVLLEWIGALPWVDPERIGMSGGSYGGFITAFTMTQTELIAAGIALAPVTDWKDYDTIYTERYMDTPQANPEGYAATSVVQAADRLHGRLLLVHGTLDDNVHPQHTLRLAKALQEAEKPFELMIYPQSRHGIRGNHARRLQLEFMKRWLKPERYSRDSSSTPRPSATRLTKLK